MFPFIFAALVFVTLSNLSLIVIPNFSLMGCERSHHAKRCHIPHPVINLKRRRDIGFPAHRGDQWLRFQLGKVKDFINPFRKS